MALASAICNRAKWPRRRPNRRLRCGFAVYAPVSGQTGPYRRLTRVNPPIQAMNLAVVWLLHSSAAFGIGLRVGGANAPSASRMRV